MPIFRIKSVKVYTGQKKFTRIYPWDPWQIWGMQKQPRNQVRRVRLGLFYAGLLYLVEYLLLFFGWNWNSIPGKLVGRDPSLLEAAFCSVVVTQRWHQCRQHRPPTTTRILPSPPTSFPTAAPTSSQLLAPVVLWRANIGNLLCVLSICFSLSARLTTYPNINMVQKLEC